MAALLDAYDDAAFDEQLPINLQLKATCHFTPVDVARHAARLLAPEAGVSVLDVGSGAGKFCIAAGRAIPGAQFIGVEWRPHLVQIATQLAEKARLSNVRFVHEDALAINWSDYDGFYFYNPFAEQLSERPFLLDETIAVDPPNFVTYVMGVRERLARARLGTRVATYHGFGGPPPLGYELDRMDAIGSDRVELWVKTAP